MTDRIPPPLATDADTAVRHALLVPDGKAAHLHCIGLMATRPRRAVPAIR